MIHKAWGMTDASPQDLKLYFNALRVNYSYLYREESGGYKRKQVLNRKEQQRFPVIVEGVQVMARLSAMERHDNLVVFCFLSKAELLNSNLTPLAIGVNEPLSVVKYALKVSDEKPFVFKFREPTILEIVATVNTPSVLQSLQTLYYKIPDSEVRNRISNTVLDYIRGKATRKKTMQVLSTTLLQEEIVKILKTDEALRLRQSVQEFLKGADLDETAKKYKVDTFDINFITQR